MSELFAMRNEIPQTGVVTWLGVRPVRRGDLQVVSSMSVDMEGGIVDDHFSGEGTATRAVTLIQKEHIDAMENILGQKITPDLLRRNIVVAGINLIALKGQDFSIGTAVLHGTGPCHPCSRMEENLGPGGYNAMRGHGGLTARVVKDGVIGVGDVVALVR